MLGDEEKKGRATERNSVQELTVELCQTETSYKKTITFLIVVNLD